MDSALGRRHLCGAERRCRRSADCCGRRRAAPLRHRSPARRVLGPVRRMALSETGRSGPQTAGAAAHPKTAGSFLLHPSPSPAAGALGRMPCLSPSAALAAGLCLVHRAGGPDARPAGAGRRRPVGGRAFPGKCRHTGKARRRRICPAPER